MPGQERLGKLRDYLPGYLGAVMKMDNEDCNRLVAQLAEVFAALGESA